MVSNVYSKSYIHSSPAVHAQAETILSSRLLPIVSNAASAAAVVDVHDLWMATTMDFVNAYIFGLRSGSNFLQDEKYRHHWLSLYHSRRTYTFFAQELPRLTAFFRYLGVRLVPKWVDDANQEIEAWCADMCMKATKVIRSGESVKNVDEPIVVRALLQGIERERSSKGQDSLLAATTLANEDLSMASEMLDHSAAGHETSGITLTYLTYYLSQDLKLQHELRAELLTLDPPVVYNSITGNLQLPDSSNLDKLPILHAVLMETLRLKAAIPGGQPRMSPQQGTTLGGYQIPGGIRIAAQAFSLHRNPEVYPSPEIWDHTRWLKADDKSRDRWFWAFSSGGRMCVGSNFAMHGKPTLLL
jgi:cytochrome P450